MDYFISDTHFGHENIIRYCDRPFGSVDDMNAAMIQRWNAVVCTMDRVYHLGDFALGPKSLWRSYREALNGQIVFVLGNHDTPYARWAREVLAPGDSATEQTLIHGTKWGDIHLAHAPLGWREERHGEVVTRAGDETLADLYLCGHVHGLWREKIINGKRCINVGVDVWDFTPQPLEALSLSHP